MKKTLLSIGAALLVGFSAMAQEPMEEPLQFNGGWGGQDIKSTTQGFAPAVVAFKNDIIGENAGYGAVGEVGRGSIAWGGLDLSNGGQGYTAVVLRLGGEGAPIPLRIKVQVLKQENGAIYLNSNNEAEVNYEVESADCEAGDTEIIYPINNISASDLKFVRILMMLGAETYDVTVNIDDFFVTDDPALAAATPGNGDLTFNSDEVGNAYKVVYPWGGEKAQALIVEDGSNKALQVTTPAVEDGVNYVVSFPNIALPTGKTWGMTKAISFKVKVTADADPGIGTEEEISFGVDFGAGLPNSGAQGINFGAGEGHPQENFWKVEQVFKGSSDWQTVVQEYDAETMVAADDVDAASRIDFYLGIHKSGVTVLLDDIKILDYVPVVGIKTVNGEELQVVNGVVYAAGQIVVTSVTGQVVAVVNDEFDTNSLNGGIYIIKAADGRTVKIVK